MNLFHAVKEQAGYLEDKPVLLMFSGGKDAVVSADLWLKYHRGPKKWIYFYFVDGLDYVERTLKFYEKKWSIEILRRPCHETLSLEARQDDLASKKKFNRSDIEKRARAETGIDWIVSGTRRSDSLAVRGMLKSLGTSGIDEKARKVYPVIDWPNKHIFSYCKLNKLPLPITYSLGFDRSVWVPNAEGLLWIKTHFPQDYRRVIDKFPELEHGIFRIEEQWSHGSKQA